MKRDMDLYRQILREVESWSTTLMPKEVTIEGYTRDQIDHHAWLLADERLIEGEDAPLGGAAPVHRYWPKCLTSKGHDFLAAAQNETRWKWAKDKLVEHALPLTVKLLGTYLQASVKAEISKLTG